jgi:hypothetical protein
VTDPSRQRAMVLQPAYPDLWRFLSQDLGPLAAFRELRTEALFALHMWVGGVPSQTPIKVTTVRMFGYPGPRFTEVEVPLDEDDPSKGTELVTVEEPTWGIQAEGTYDMRQIPEHAHGYEQARKYLAEADETPEVRLTVRLTSPRDQS